VKTACLLSIAALTFSSVHAHAATKDEPHLLWPRSAPSLPGESEGPFARLVIEGGMLVDGTGAPPVGPVTVVVEKDRIVEIYGLPGMYTAQVGESGRYAAKPGDKVIDARGSYILPGLIDAHVRVLDLSVRPDTGNTSRQENSPPEYALKLLIANGVTTIASMQSLDVMDWAMDMKRQSAANTITAPNVEVWVDFPARTPEEARAKVREAKKRGATGLGEGDIEGSLEVMLAGLDEAKKANLPTYWCLHDEKTQQMNTLQWARAGMTGWPHANGLPNAMYEDRELRFYPGGFNYNNPHDAMRLYRWAGVKPGGEKWNSVIDELVKLDFTFGPTFSVYEVHRDYVGVSRQEWNDEYLHPALRRIYMPGDGRYNTEFADWSTEDEVTWRNIFHVWMQFVNDFKNRGGRVIAGSDPGYYWTTYGFGFIRNLELLQEAGFSPLEVIKSASLDSAKWLRIANDTGSVEIGKRADLIVVDANPLKNLKVLYGTGAVGAKPDGTIGRIGGVKYTIKSGVVFDAKKVLANVRDMVREAEARDAAAK
jgi:dihydroorotase-like cyclic amidohydrolase